jgi:hypothetical protein
VGGVRGTYLGENFGGGPKEKRQLRRPMHKQEDNIKTDLQEVGWGRNLLI